jgi:hypothetical protein
MTTYNNTPAFGRGYYSLLFASILFGGLLLAKILVYMCGTPYSPGWMWLTALNAAEACGWTLWIIDRHGPRIGPVLLLPPLLCTLYSTVPIVLLSISPDIFPYSEEVIRRGMFLQSLMATHFWLFWCVMFSKRTGRSILEKTNAWLDGLLITTGGAWLFIAVGFALSLTFFVNFFVSGTAALIGHATRLEAIASSETGKTWLIELVFAVWLMTLTILLNSSHARASLRFAQAPFIVIAIALFLYPYLQLGNRNELSICLIFACLILCIRGRTKLVAACFAVTVPPMLYLGLTRGGGADPFADVASISFYLKLLGEFVFPHYPLLDHISSRKDLWYGWSYLRLPLVVLPTFGLWHKPLSLALQFAQEYGGVGSMGYAYTPLGEGFANFGLASIVIVPFYLSAMGRALASKWFKAPLPFIAFVAISQNTARGEFVSLVQAIVIIVTALYFFLAITRVRIGFSLASAHR